MQPYTAPQVSSIHEGSPSPPFISPPSPPPPLPPPFHLKLWFSKSMAMCRAARSSSTICCSDAGVSTKRRGVPSIDL